MSRLKARHIFTCTFYLQNIYIMLYFYTQNIPKGGFYMLFLNAEVNTSTMSLEELIQARNQAQEFVESLNFQIRNRQKAQRRYREPSSKK